MALALEESAARTRRHGFCCGIATGPTAKIFQACLEAMEIGEVLTAPQSPWQNPYVERLIGSMRRECVDHVIVRLAELAPEVPGYDSR